MLQFCANISRSQTFQILKNLQKKSANLFLLCALSFVAFSCAQGKVDPFDTNSGLSRSEIEDSIIKKSAKNSENAEKKSPKNITPKISSLVVAPPPPVLGGDKIISFSVSNQVPLKDILIELGRIANIDIDIDSSVSGSVIINAKDRPLKEIIDRIATLGSLRYSYKNGVLFFENDSPYIKSYFVDYLIAGKLWGEVETNIKAIMEANEVNKSATKTTDENSTTTGDKVASFSSNKSAGIISVFASNKQHQAVTKYLKDVERYASSQVLIEAKVVEVTLSKEFAAGIDWSWADSENSVKSEGTFGVGDTTQPYITALFGSNSSITANVKALEQFGTAKAISSPRITTMNNQNANLNFSESLIYFTIATSASTVAGLNNPTTVASVTATKNEIPIGVQLSITPSINIATNEVTLDIQPTLSVDSGKEAIDPSINPATGLSLGNKIPIVKTRTLKTLAKIQSGNVLVIGGLMSDTTADSETGIPFISKIPVLGYLFKYTAKSTQIVETVIFIKATIVDSSGFTPKEDRDLQEKFDVNKRKFF